MEQCDTSGLTGQEGLIYHVAPHRVAESIRQFGLDPSAEQTRCSALAWNQRGIYLWDNLELAHQYGQEQFGNCYHIYRIQPHEDDSMWPDQYGDERPDLVQYQHSFVAPEGLAPGDFRRLDAPDESPAGGAGFQDLP